MSGRFFMGLVIALAPASGIAAQQSSMQTINSAKTELAASQQSSAPSTNSAGTAQQPAPASQGSLGDVVRQQRVSKSRETVPTSGGQASNQQQKSLGEIAAERRVTQPTVDAAHRANVTYGTHKTDVAYRKARRKPANHQKRDPFGQPVSSAAR